jgi:DNA-binding GntR family transcriptional regulator
MLPPSPQTLEVTKTQTLPSLVYQKLKEAILNGVFSPGQMLRQDEVATKLGVSRSPLREALPRLEADGIVVLHPRRGYAVAALDPKQITEVFDLRCLLESELARRSIENRTDSDIANIYLIVAEMKREAERETVNDLSHWFNLNMQFHRALLIPANCPHHLRALQHSRTLIEAYIRTEVRLTGDLQEAQTEHNLLAQAFVLGNITEFINITRQHSEHTRDRLLRRLPSSH